MDVLVAPDRFTQRPLKKTRPVRNLDDLKGLRCNKVETVENGHNEKDNYNNERKQQWEI